MLTRSGREKVRETVDGDTPAWRATSYMVMRRLPLEESSSESASVFIYPYQPSLLSPVAHEMQANEAEYFLASKYKKFPTAHYSGQQSGGKQTATPKSHKL